MVLAALFGAVPFLVMSWKGPVPFGFHLGLLGLLACIGCILHAMSVPALPREKVRPAIATAAAIVTFWALAVLATHGAIPSYLSALALPLAFVGVLAGLDGLFPGEGGRPLARRHGFWLLALHGALGLPRLGTIGLFDPWEAHYGEVAREMIARDDWISTFWAHEGWFTSKPVLLMWMQALSMRALGVHHEPGRMLEGASALAHPEWALRLPIFMVASVGLYVLYKGAANALDRPRALLGALALATTPYWIFLTRQSVTDMPLVGFLAASMGFLLMALHTPESARVTPGKLHGGHALVVGIVLVVLPQVLYLASRNVALSWEPGAHGFLWHVDLVHAGSAGNCTLPGQIPCTTAAPFLTRFPPVLQAALWAALGVGLILLVRAETRVARLFALAAWFFAALATMAKGPAGLAIPIGTALGYAALTGRWRPLVSLTPVVGLLLAALFVVPWYVATYARHGRLFVDELVLRHMLGRTLDHLHDTNEGDDTSFRYYVAQLGYGLFPWSGLVLLGAVRALRPRALRAERFLLLWSLLAFGLVTIMGTKFHHYAFLAVPPLAMLGGIGLGKLAERPKAALLVVAATFTAFVARDFFAREPDGQALLVHLFTYQYARAWPAFVDVRAPLGALALLAVVLPLAARYRRAAPWAVTGALASALFLGTVYLARTAPHWGQHDVLAAYEARRGESSAPLVAYQLNWKGENFYTGNRLALYGVGGGGGPPLRTYATDLAARGTHTLFVVTEPSRVGNLRGEMPPGSRSEVVTSEQDSRQFCLVRVSL